MSRADKAAEILWSAWQSSRRMDALPEACRPRDLDEGYAVQAALGALAGRHFGWKIAATSAAGQRHIGVTAPLAGPLFERFALEGGARIAAGDLHMAVAEPEFAFRFARPIRPGDAHDREAVLAAVGKLHLAIEVPDSRFEDFARASAPQLVADAACARWFVLGREAKGWRGRDLAAVPVTIGDDAGTVHEGSGANALGDPRTALAWLVADRLDRGIAIEAGCVVTTGTCAAPLPIAPGRIVTARFGDLGRVAVVFV